MAEADAGVVINGHVQGLPAGMGRVLGAVCRDPMAGTLEAVELLGVEVQQLASAAALVARPNGPLLQGWQLGQPRSLAGARHGAAREPHALGDALVGQPLRAPQRQGTLDLGSVAAPRAAVRPRAAVEQLRVALDVAAVPLACSAHAHPGGRRRCCEPHPLDFSDQMRSTFGRH
ncbi:hypothetical protein ALISP_4259 [Alicycliphilus sp. B1]|nr:hypothetical protein ALISP_4259 [Alicycliphilus sp. B1]